MTNTDPRIIESDIERTRRELGSDVDALTEKVTPSKIMNRQTDRARSALRSAKERVFGAVGDVQERAADATSGAPQKIAEKARGNPLAAGLIAFGVGWLAASMVPPSRKEKELTSTLQEKAQPLMGEVGDAAKHVAEDLREPAKEAMDSVKESASEAAETVKSEGTSTADDLRRNI